MGLLDLFDKEGSLLIGERQKKPSKFLNNVFTNGQGLARPNSIGIQSSREPTKAPTPIVIPPHILLEDGFDALYEDGGRILLEDGVV